MMLQTTIEKNILQNNRNMENVFDEIVMLYEKPVMHFLYKFTGRAEDSEDLTQETLIKVYRNIDKFNPEYKFSTWVFAIAKNTAFDWLRKNRNKELLLIDDENNTDEILTAKQYMSSMDQERRFKTFDLRVAMENIRPVYKSVLTLFYIHGYSYKEIAQIHDIPTNTVKTYIYRAKLLLRKNLA